MASIQINAAMVSQSVEREKVLGVQTSGQDQYMKGQIVYKQRIGKERDKSESEGIR